MTSNNQAELTKDLVWAAIYKGKHLVTAVREIAEAEPDAAFEFCWDNGTDSVYYKEMYAGIERERVLDIRVYRDMDTRQGLFCIHF